MTSSIGNKFDELKGDADDAVLDDAKQKIDELQKLLEGGPPRAPIDFEKEKATFRRGKDLSTPDGGDPQAAAPPNAGDGPPLSAAIKLGKRIEFIHYGCVHRDSAANFAGTDAVDDLDGALDATALKTSRAVAFRAALQREAILLACFAQSVERALDEKDTKEGSTSDLLEAAADLVGGAAMGEKDTAVAADLQPFITRLNAVWRKLNKVSVGYADLHSAGRELHELRANLLKYLFELIDPNKSPPDPATPGLLSNLPFVGPIPIPGVLGDVVGVMQKVTGKIYDVQMKLCFSLILAMHEPIENACSDLALEAMLQRRPPLYPVWYSPAKATDDTFDGLADKLTEDQDGDATPFANMASPLNVGGVSGAAQNELNGAMNRYVNNPVSNAMEAPLNVVDFLSETPKAAPGNAFLNEAFQASLGKGQGLPVFKDSEALADLAVSSICTSIVDEMPGFMEGIVGDIIKQVFRISVEFIRGVYGVLLTYPSVAIDADALMAAGRKHLLVQLMDLVTKEFWVDDFLKSDTARFTIPALPVTPAGINWPTGTQLSLEPLVYELKRILAEQIQPYLEPVLDVATSGLAARLTAARSWAGTDSVTMEVHLGQLPVEIALLFRNLFGPLWDFITDTVMGWLSDQIAKVLGPVADGLGMGGDMLTKVEDSIAKAEGYAQNARDYAANVENRTRDLVDKISNFKGAAGLGGLDDGGLSDAADALGDAIGADPLGNPGGAGGGPGAGGFGRTPIFMPSIRRTMGVGVKISSDDYKKVAEEHQWDDALPADGGAAPGDSGDGAADGDALASAAGAP